MKMSGRSGLPDLQNIEKRNFKSFHCCLQLNLMKRLMLFRLLSVAADAGIRRFVSPTSAGTLFMWEYVMAAGIHHQQFGRLQKIIPLSEFLIRLCDTAQVAAGIIQDTATGKNYKSCKRSGSRRLRDAIVLGYQLQRVPGRDVSIPE
ncbi:hypothetical protein Leryth_013256 [Lithospermum erythrorhizon]|nr:hypothetical protein Leryth_013256 [Lithospermum erythrorhizon]